MPATGCATITAAEVNGSEIVRCTRRCTRPRPRTSRVKTARLWRESIWSERTRRVGASGRWTAAEDRKKLLEPLLDRQERFVIVPPGSGSSSTAPSDMERGGVGRPVVGCASGAHHQIQDGQETTYELRYGVEPIRMVGRQEQLHLVVVSGSGKSLCCCSPPCSGRARDSQSLWGSYTLSHALEIEEDFRFITRATTWKTSA
jgi:hypothetical protein